jgi:hypothetical protein
VELEIIDTATKDPLKERVSSKSAEIFTPAGASNVTFVFQFIMSYSPLLGNG